MQLAKDLNKWELLLEEAEVIYQYADHLNTVSLDKLIKLETENSIILPQEYKEFCQVFGIGKFGKNQFKIRIPGIEEGEDILESRQLMIASYSDIYEHGKMSISLQAQNMIKDSYNFGEGDGYKSFVFDLNSYKHTDLSCDIYVFYCCMNGYYKYICRDFFEFIKFFCLDNHAQSKFSEIFDFRHHYDDIDDPMARYGTFSPFPLEI